MQPIGTKKITKPLENKKNRTTSRDKNHAISWDKKLMQPIRIKTGATSWDKKLMQPLRTKKFTQPLGTIKNHAISQNKKNHAFSLDEQISQEKNHTKKTQNYYELNRMAFKPRLSWVLFY